MCYHNDNHDTKYIHYSKEEKYKHKQKQKQTKTTMAFHFIPIRLHPLDCQQLRSLTIPITKCHKSSEENPKSRIPNKCYRSRDLRTSRQGSMLAEFCLTGRSN